jgi:hypothetical protein
VENDHVHTHTGPRFRRNLKITTPRFLPSSLNKQPRLFAPNAEFQSCSLPPEKEKDSIEPQSINQSANAVQTPFMMNLILCVSCLLNAKKAQIKKSENNAKNSPVVA